MPPDSAHDLLAGVALDCVWQSSANELLEPARIRPSVALEFLEIVLAGLLDRDDMVTACVDDLGQFARARARVP